MTRSKVEFAITDPHYRPLIELLGSPEQWAIFLKGWGDMAAMCERGGIPVQQFLGMVAWNLGMGIGGQPAPDENARDYRDDAMKLAWDTLMHGGEHAGMDMNAWMERLKAKAPRPTEQEGPI